MQVQFILTGKSVSTTKFDDLGILDISEDRIEEIANGIALRIRQENRRRKVVSVFKIDEDMACYTVFDNSGTSIFTRSYEEAATKKRSQAQIERTLQNSKIVKI